MGRLRGEMKPSQDRWWGWHTIVRDGDPYMTRFWVGRLRLHIFHRGDHDPDCHDHPWDFWTFPLTSYVEEVLHPHRDTYLLKDHPPPARFYRTLEVVKAWRWHARPAEHCHRVLGSFEGYPPSGMFPGAIKDTPKIGNRRIVTIVWQCGVRRKWGFWKNREGRWCWQPWKEYILAGGKNAPCD